VTLNATIIEVPVKFYKDRNGRESHHKREGWLSPFKAAWINLRAMFAYGADAFLIKPGGLLAVLGALLTLAVTLGPVDIGPIVLSVFWQMFGAFIFATGINFFLIGLNIRQQITNPRTQFKFTKELFKYNRAVFTAFLLVVSGVFLMSPLLGTYISAGLILDGTDIWQQHLAITGLSLIVCGATYFVNVLINQSLSQFLNEARNKRESK
jgi:hypothetical protein